MSHRPKRARLEQYSGDETGSLSGTAVVSTDPVRDSIACQHSYDAILESIYADLARGILHIDSSWNDLPDYTVGTVFHEIFVNQHDRDCASLTQLAVRGHVGNGITAALLQLARQESLSSLQELHLTETAVGLLPTLVPCCPDLHALVVRDPVVVAKGITRRQERKWWMRVLGCLQGHAASWQRLHFDWNTMKSEEDDAMEEEYEDEPEANPWLTLLFECPNLTEFHQQGDGPRRWTGADIGHLLWHPTLRRITLDVKCHSVSSSLGAWMPVPAERNETMRVRLPILSAADCRRVFYTVPHYVLLLPEATSEAPVSSPMIIISEQSEHRDCVMGSPRNVATQFWEEKDQDGMISMANLP